MGQPGRVLMEFLLMKFLKVFIAFVFFGVVKILAHYVEKLIAIIRVAVSRRDS
jgi:hypothetical protein